MKNEMKRFVLALMAVVVVGSMCYLSFDHELTASESDGSTTAVEQQQAVEEAEKPVEVVVPAKEEPEAAEPAAEPAKEEPKAAEPAKEEPKAGEPVAVVNEVPAAEEAATEAPQAEAPTTEEPAEAMPEAEETAVADLNTDAAAVESAPIETEAPAPTGVPAANENAAGTLDIPAVTAEITAEPTAEPTVTPEAAAEPEIFVEVRLKNKGDLYFGDTAELEAIVECGDDIAYTLQWQYDDGHGWKDISGMNKDEYKFVLTEENAVYEYRAVVISA